MSVAFIPYWVTPSSSLASIEEDVPVQIQLNVQEYFTTQALAGDYNLQIGSTVSRVVELTADGQIIGFTINTDDGDLRFSELQSPVTLTVYRSPQLVFSLLNGVLPTGLSLTSTGWITGTPTKISPGVQTFLFTVRVANESMVRDRAFSIQINGSISPAYLNHVTLPPQTSANGLTAHDLGSVAPGQQFIYTIDVLQQEMLIPEVTITYVSDIVETPTLHNGLPLGLKLDSSLNLRGMVDLNAVAGDYYFSIIVNDPDQTSQTVFKINVMSDRLTFVDSPLNLTWVTEQGRIGEIEVLCPVCATVEAASNRTQPVYSLDPLSDALPAGIMLDPQSGQLQGIASLLTDVSTYNLSIRATIGYAFIRRAFTISSQSSLSSSSVYQAVLQIDYQTAQIINQGIQALIPAQYRFRPSDVNFGTAASSLVYLIAGLNTIDDVSSLVEPDTQSVAAQSYYSVLNLITGSFAFSLVKDSTGIPLYEVIYRRLFDPNSGAGGFTTDATGRVVAQTVQDGKVHVSQNVYVNSLVNIRADLVLKLGLAANSESQTYSFAAEPLPCWMTAFAPAQAIAYMRVGTSKKVVDLLNTSISPISQGNIIGFDKIILFGPNGSVDLIQLQ